MLIIPLLRQLPVGINGISLSSCGVGVLLRVFIPLYSDSDANVIILVLLFISLILASLYILKCILFFKEKLLSYTDSNRRDWFTVYCVYRSRKFIL